MAKKKTNKKIVKKKPATIDSIKTQDEYLQKLVYMLDNKKMFQLDKTTVAMLRSFLMLEGRVPSGAGGKADLLRLSKILNKTQAEREEAASIQIDHLKIMSRLNQLYVKARSYLYSSYGDMIYSHRSGDVRSNIIDDILDPLVERRKLCESIVEVADLVLDILKDRYFTLCKVNDNCLALIPDKIKRDA